MMEVFVVWSFLMFCIISRWIEVVFAYRQAKKGHVIASWTIHALAVFYVIFILVAGFEFQNFNRQLNWQFFLPVILLYCANLYFRYVCIHSLRGMRSYQVELRNQHVLVKNGIYQQIRHPIYLAMILEALLIPMSVLSWVALLIAILVYIPIIFLRIRIEEKSLLRIFGDEYIQYMKSVPTLIPKWRLNR